MKIYENITHSFVEKINKNTHFSTSFASIDINKKMKISMIWDILYSNILLIQYFSIKVTTDLVFRILKVLL